MKRLYIILTIFAACLFAAACDPMAEFVSGDKVTITMNLDVVSCGYVKATFTPSKPAYYLVSFDKVVKGINPEDYEQQFMDLALDSAYVEYVTWRHEHLLKGEEYVADFPSHSLNYGETTVYQHFLEPDTDYWMYCFVVDANSNKANGKLFYQVVHTKAESIYKTIRFGYRVKGVWDYVYPYEQTGNELATYVPYVAETVDSLQLRLLEYNSPGEFFDDEFQSMSKWYSRILLGIYAHKNDGVGDGTSTTNFEEGHTYYTAMATFDGKRNECFDVYRFRWEGENTSLTFKDSDSTKGGW